MHLPHITQTQEFRPGKEGDPILSRSIWSYRHTVLGALGIFLYVGVEVGLASIAVNYFKTQGVDSAEDRFVPGVAVLGRRAGRPPAGLVDTDQDQVAASCLASSDLAATLFVFVSMMSSRAGGDLGHGDLRILQLHHVPEHLCAGHRRAGADDQQGIGADHDGGCGRRGGAVSYSGARPTRWASSTRSSSRYLLPLHRLLRALWGPSQRGL